MNCLNPKHKNPVRLKTLVTITTDNIVRRKRKCPICESVFYSLEYFESEIMTRAEAISNNELHLQMQITTLCEKLERRDDIFKMLKQVFEELSGE